MPDLPKSSILLSRLVQHIGRGMAGMLEIQIRPCGLTEAGVFACWTTLFFAAGGECPPQRSVREGRRRVRRTCRASAMRWSGRDLIITRLSSLHDRRKMVLRITEQGEELVRRLLPTMYGPPARNIQGFLGRRTASID